MGFIFVFCRKCFEMACNPGVFSDGYGEQIDRSNDCVSQVSGVWGCFGGGWMVYMHCPLSVAVTAAYLV